jgi:hypothetical protein
MHFIKVWMQFLLLKIIHNRPFIKGKILISMVNNKQIKIQKIKEKDKFNKNNVIK